MNKPTSKQPNPGRCRRILVINAKGGCGKTTVATNLCAAYAARGVSVALLDHDSQAAGAYWAEQRPAHAPPVGLVPEMRGRSPERIIIDGTQGEDADALAAWADILLTPILPSTIDVRAGGNFITGLMTKPRFRAQPRPIGVIANRAQSGPGGHPRLMHLLRCLNVPLVATLRDSPVYSQAMESGEGVAGLIDSRAARKEMVAWRALVEWIEGQLPSGATTPRPLAAGRPRRKTPLSA